MQTRAAAVASVAVALLSLGVVDTEESSAQAPTRPNILIIVTDDQRAGTTKHMAQVRRFFQARGTSFPQAFDTTPLCCPSRASIFTGRYTHNHGVRDTVSAHLLDQSTTLQRYLRDAGYSTAVTGKFLNHWDMSTPPPHFDRWAVFSGDPGKDGYYEEDWNIDGTRQTLPGYTTKIITRKSLRFLEDFEADEDRPWLLFVFPYAPHGPFTAEPKYRGASPPRWSGNPALFEKKLGDKPPWLRPRDKSPAEARRIRKLQYRTLLSVDDMVGSIFNKLNELGEASSTMAFYLSDNGFMWGEHGVIGKRHPYLSSVRTPFFLRWPGRVTRGAVDRRMVANIDIFPTAMEAAQMSPAEPLHDGTSILSAIDRRRLLLEYWRDPVAPGLPTWASTLTKTRQFTEYYGSDGTIRFRELYNLDTDPHQLRNRLGDGSRRNDPSPSRLSFFHQRLTRDRSCTGNECP